MKLQAGERRGCGEVLEVEDQGPRGEEKGGREVEACVACPDFSLLSQVLYVPSLA